MTKNLLANARDTSLIPLLGRSPGGGNGNPLQDSCLENPMDRGACWATVHGVAKSQTWLSLQTQQNNNNNNNKRKVWLILWEKKAGKRNYLWEWMNVTFYKDFKVAIISMFNKLKESMIKEVRENVITVSHQIDRIHKEMQIVKGSKWKFWSFKVQ